MMIAMKKLTAWLLTLAMCITMAPGLTLTATAATGDPCTLEVYADPGPEAGSVKCNKGAGPYHVGDSITLEATANPGYSFSGWINLKTEEVRYESKISFVLEGDTQWLAMFKKDGEYFIYVSEPSDLGVAPEQSSYAPGTKITLTAPYMYSDHSTVYEIGKDVDGSAGSVTWERLEGRTFVMPAYDVWVRALYIKDPEVTYYTSDFSYEIKDDDKISSKVTYTKHKTTDFQIVDENTTEWRRDPDGIMGGLNGIYVVDRDITIKNRVTVSCTEGAQVTLVICDGCTLIAEEGITVPEYARLDICVQHGGKEGMSEEAGKLYAGVDARMINSCSVFSAGIGGGSSGEGKQNCGKIYIHGGTVVAAAGNNYRYTAEDGTTTIGEQEGGAGIGGGAYGNGGTVYICCANVIAQGGHNVSAGGAGIGGGACGTGGTINIINSTVKATSGGSIYGGAGIGSGGLVSGKENSVYNKNAAGNILLFKSTVTASGVYSGKEKFGGAGIGGGGQSGGGNVKIFGGDVKATGAGGAAGIGGGSVGGACDLQVLSACVEAYGGDNPVDGWNPACGAGIGTGGNMSFLDSALPGGKVTIGGDAKVLAVGGSDLSGFNGANCGAGIGGGGCGNILLVLFGAMVPPSGCEVNITGGTVIAKGGNADATVAGNGGAGIGTGGYEGQDVDKIDCGTLTITGGSVEAYGGSGKSGFGGAGVGFGGTGASFNAEFKSVPVRLTGGSLVAVGGDDYNSSNVSKAIGGVYSGNHEVPVTNSMAGAGWTTRDREDNGTLIGIESQKGRSIGGYNAVAFPAYALTLNSNDGTDTKVTRYAINGDKLPANIFSCEGHILDGWNTLAVPTDEDPGTAYDNGQTLELTEDLTLYAQWKEGTVETTYTVTVNNGSGSADYEAGESVTIKADEPAEGQKFKEWEAEGIELTEAQKTSTELTFTMPGNAVTLTATYEDETVVEPPTTKYTVTVTNGTGGGEFAEGAEVTVNAKEPETGKEFKNWTAEGISLTDVQKIAASLTFTMPANAVTLTATYEDKSEQTQGGGNGNGGNSGGGSTGNGGSSGGHRGGGGSSGGSGGGGNTPGTVDQKPAEEQPQVTEPTTIGEDDTPLSGAHTFEDVTPGAFYAEPVAWAIENSITNGLGGNKFGPAEKCNRGQVLTFIYRAMGSPAVNTDGLNFTDVDSDAYCRDAVAWAVGMGITSGTSETTFDPDETCNRAQIVTLLWRAAGSPKVESTVAFSDVTPDMYCYDAVAWAVSRGITQGTSDTTFSPDETCDRGQVVTFLYRYIKTNETQP